MSINCDSLKEIIPHMIRELLEITIECFDKQYKGKDILPIQSTKRFQILHSTRNHNVILPKRNTTLTSTKFIMDTFKLPSIKWENTHLSSDNFTMNTFKLPSSGWNRNLDNYDFIYNGYIQTAIYWWLNTHLNNNNLIDKG